MMKRGLISWQPLSIKTFLDPPWDQNIYLDNLAFSNLEDEDRARLTALFTLEEIKSVFFYEA